MDLAIAHWINAFGRGVIDPLTDFVCAVPFLVVLWLGILVLAGRLDRTHGRRVAQTVVLAVLVHVVVTELTLKHLILADFPMRVRPYLAHPDLIVPVGYRFTDSSFPSSHCASTAAIVTVLGYHYRRFALLGAAFAVVMCLSRVHNGMHYPTDVLTGSFLGLAYGALSVRAMDVIVKRRAVTQAPALIG